MKEWVHSANGWWESPHIVKLITTTQQLPTMRHQIQDDGRRRSVRELVQSAAQGFSAETLRAARENLVPDGSVTQRSAELLAVRLDRRCRGRGGGSGAGRGWWSLVECFMAVNIPSVHPWATLTVTVMHRICCCCRWSSGRVHLRTLSLTQRGLHWPQSVNFWLFHSSAEAPKVLLLCSLRQFYGSLHDAVCLFCQRVRLGFPEMYLWTVLDCCLIISPPPFYIISVFSLLDSLCRPTVTPQVLLLAAASALTVLQPKRPRPLLFAHISNWQ